MKPAFHDTPREAAAMAASATIRVARRYDAPTVQVFAAWNSP